MDALISIPLRSLAEKIRIGELSSYELVSGYLQRIDQHQPKLNCMTVCRKQEALEEARCLDQERREKGVRGALHGIPFTAKDNFDVANRSLIHSWITELLSRS